MSALSFWSAMLLRGVILMTTIMGAVYVGLALVHLELWVALIALVITALSGGLLSAVVAKIETGAWC